MKVTIDVTLNDAEEILIGLAAREKFLVKKHMSGHAQEIRDLALELSSSFEKEFTVIPGWYSRVRELTK